MVQVPGGAFLRGSPAAVGLVDEHPPRTIDLDPFWIDVTEVTQADYARCVAARGCPPVRCSRWLAADPTLPVSCVDWEQANAYCAWAHKRLPTEAEWEKAARGTDGRLYPWGNAVPTCELARYYGCGTAKPDPVGSHPKGVSPYGALDMAGNVWEWVADWYDDAYYSKAPDKNPPGPDQGEQKIVRGGAFKYGPRELLSASRTFDNPGVHYEHVGVRCAAATPPEATTTSDAGLPDASPPDAGR
jgi:formylglycine-generating enzyme required for sulfatase activity